MSIPPRTHGSRDRLRRVGALWKPRAGGKSKGSGSITIGTMRQRFVILTNDRKEKDSDPDYVLMSSDEPEVDEYAQRRQEPPARRHTPEAEPW